MITSYFSSVGHGGSQQTMYFCEVTDSMLVCGGGGNQSEGELIQVVYVPVDQAENMALDPTKVRTSGLCFAMIWFNTYKRNLYC